MQQRPSRQRLSSNADCAWRESGLKPDSHGCDRTESTKGIIVEPAAVLLLVDAICVTPSQENFVLYPTDEPCVQGAMAIPAKYSISE
jgi:hypothetical protein